MMSRVYTKIYSAPPVDLDAVTRYARATVLTPEAVKLRDECLAICLPKTVYKVCYTELPLTFNGKFTVFGKFETDSAHLKARLDGCHSVIVFAATAGMEYDRLVRGYGKLDAAKAFMFQAIGTERVESLCDLFCEELKKSKNALGEDVTARFSPGYGDLTLKLQKDVFDILNCEKHIGVFLNDSLLMTPSKSVTDIVGIKKQAL